MKIFLSGQVRTNWRDNVIKAFPTYCFFNPKKEGWTRFDIYDEIAEMYRSDIIVILLDDLAGGGTKGEMKLAELFGKQIIYGDTSEQVISRIKSYIVKPEVKK